LHDLWGNNNVETALPAILSDKQLWGEDLTVYNGFESAVLKFIKRLHESRDIKTIMLLSNDE